MCRFSNSSCQLTAHFSFTVLSGDGLNMKSGQLITVDVQTSNSAVHPVRPAIYGAPCVPLRLCSHSYMLATRVALQKRGQRPGCRSQLCGLAAAKKDGIGIFQVEPGVPLH